MRNTGIPLLIDDDTSHSLTFEQIKQRVDTLSLAFSSVLDIKPDTVVALFSPNALDYPIVIWAAHRLGATVSAANPAFTPTELSYQLDAAKAHVFIVHEDQLDAGMTAAQKAGIAKEKVLVIQSVQSIRQQSASDVKGCKTVEQLVRQGEQIFKKEGEQALKRTRRTLKAGEGQSKLAFISFSSGTTGGQHFFSKGLL
jgi:4-coumarate--CoA ligase